MKHPKPRALIMAGGTGGHIFPALAIARSLQQQNWDVHWLGTRQGLETDIVSRAGYPLHYISVAGIRRAGLLKLLIAPYQMIRAFFQSLQLIVDLDPDVVLGMGGFASGPGGVAAWILRKPLIIHEQNAIPGMTNHYLAKIAYQVFEAFPKTFPSNIHAKCCGNPVRAELQQILCPKKRLLQHDRRLRLLILGGSRGAKVLNEICPRSIKHIAEAERPEIWHQTGLDQNEVTQNAYLINGITARVDAFIHDMTTAYSWADIVLCRAGASTIAELSAVGIGSILVPFPYAVDDHQTHNARYLVEAKAALLIPQSRLTEDILASILMDFTKNREKVLSFAENARSLVKRDAVLEIVTSFNQCLKMNML